MNEIVAAILFLVTGIGADLCIVSAIYLCSRKGRLYWDKMQEVRQNRLRTNRLLRDFFNGKG